MTKLFVIILFVVCLLPLTNVNGQTCLFVSNGNMYDLTPLMGTSYQVTTGNYNWVFSPCANGNQGPMGIACSVAQDDLEMNPVAPISIFDSTMIWSTFSANGLTGIQYTTANGGPPNCYPADKPRFATIQFVCQLTGAPTFNCTSEPIMQYCAVAPGYVFQLTTPFACAGYVPPLPPPSICPYELAQPCVVKSFNQYVWSQGMSLDFNADSDACGKILFSDYVIKKQPEDTCVNSTQTGYYRLIAHMDILAFPKILQLLQAATPTNPVIYFWDDDANTAAIGPAQSSPSEDSK